MRARRALLYVPGDDLRKIRKAALLGGSSPGVDCICLDLEDGVAWQRKDAARQAIPEALLGLDFGAAERDSAAIHATGREANPDRLWSRNFGAAERLVRVNPASSGLQQEDLRAVLPARPQGIVIPKVEKQEHIQVVSQAVAAAEARYGWPPGEIILIAIIESAQGVLNLAPICSSDPRLRALALGAEDLAASLGATRTREGAEVFYARSALVLHAAANNLQAIDMVYVDLRDPDGLAQEARQASRLGFSGKQVIHPDQVAPVQAAFTPNEAEIDAARRLVQASEQHALEGRSVFTLDGRMVEIPMVEAARRLLSRAGQGLS